MKVTVLNAIDGKITPTTPRSQPNGTPTVVRVEFAVEYETGDRVSKKDWAVAVLEGEFMDDSYSAMWDGHGNNQEYVYTNGVNHVQGGTGANRPMAVNVPIYDRTTKQSFGGRYEIGVFANDGTTEMGRSTPFEILQFKPAVAPAKVA